MTVQTESTTETEGLTAEAYSDDSGFVLEYDELTSDEKYLASALFENVNKFEIDNTKCSLIDITLFYEVYHNGELVKEEKLFSKGEQDNNSIKIYTAVIIRKLDRGSAYSCCREHTTIYISPGRYCRGFRHLSRFNHFRL